MFMVLPPEFQASVVRQTLMHITLWTEPLEQLVFGTALYENSRDHPAEDLPDNARLGIYGIRSDVHQAVWSEYFPSQNWIADRISEVIATWPNLIQQLITNHVYATAIASVIYEKSIAGPFCDSDPETLGQIYPHCFNDGKGNGTPAEWTLSYRANLKA